MQDPERQIAVIKNITFEGDESPSIYDLYITDRRLVVIGSKDFYGGGGLNWILFGSNLVDVIEQGNEDTAKKQKELEENSKA